MTNHQLAAIFALTYALALGNNAFAVTTEVDADGFKNPMQRLTFNSSHNTHEFELSTLNALNVYDPLEPLNRRVYQFNYRFDQWVFLPAVRGYRYITPKPVRSGVQNFFSNLGEVPTFFNSLLQFKGRKASITTARFMFNSTFGVFGLWDPATKMGLEKQKEDLGQTLAFYGVPAGPYLVLPLLGPSNLRDAAGWGGDFLLEDSVNAFNYAKASNRHLELWGLRGINLRYSTDMAYGQLNTPFEYEAIRYIYTKARELQAEE